MRESLGVKELDELGSTSVDDINYYVNIEIRKDLFLKALEFVKSDTEVYGYERFMKNLDYAYGDFLNIFFKDRSKKEEEGKDPVPCVPIDQTVHDEYIISLENGKRYATMKKHLKRCGLTPLEYISKWNLPMDYPMVCPEYSRRRSRLAKDNQLGVRIRRKDDDLREIV